MSRRVPSRCHVAVSLGMLAGLLAGCASIDDIETDQWGFSDPVRNADPTRHSDVAEAMDRPEEDSSGFLGSDGPTLDDWSPKNFAKNWKRMTGRGPNKRLAQQLYDEAEREYSAVAEMPPGEQRTAAFLAVADKFAKAAESWPGSAVEMDALFMAGEAKFFADHYWDAAKFYEKLIKGYPNNRYLDTVDARRFAIARYWLQLHEENPEHLLYANFLNETRPWRDARGHALRQYEKIRLDDPTGKLADDATLAVANAHFKAGRFLKADESYTDLRKAYPRSEHQFDAHYLGLKAKLESYLGPDYSGAALDEGEKLIKQMRRQFPTESEQEKEFLDRAAAEIRFRQAEKEFYFGRYHDKRGEYRAAARRYRQIVASYPDTPFAEQAEQRLAQVQGLPPVPPQRLPWLARLFPTADKVKPILEEALVPEAELPSAGDEGRVLPASAEE